MPQTISFYLDNSLVEIDFETSGEKPTQTLLWYLRSLSNHKDVKEGCAEGDCGACTVAIASLGSDGKLHYAAHDSCLLFLPMLHGKWIFTPNSIGSSANMHPVQQAMIDELGPQCGFCTPGQIMAAVALLRSNPNPTRDEARLALSGNLCRCGAYDHYLNSVMRAAQSA